MEITKFTNNNIDRYRSSYKNIIVDLAAAFRAEIFSMQTYCRRDCNNDGPFAKTL